MGYIPVYFLCKKSTHMSVNSFVYMFTVCLLLYAYLFTCLQNVYILFTKVFTCIQILYASAIYQHVYIIVIIVYENVYNVLMFTKNVYNFYLYFFYLLDIEFNLPFFYNLKFATSSETK